MIPSATLPFYEQGPLYNRNRRILLIMNPVSGRLKARGALTDILERMYAVGDPYPAEWVTVALTTHRDHAAELAVKAAEEDFDLVVACGGDGTLNEVVSGLLTLPPEKRPELGYIPSGSTNDFAASLGIPSLHSRAAEVALTAPAMALDVGRFAPDGDYPSGYFSYIASFGVFTAASYSTPQAAKNVMGHAAYLLEGLKDLMSIQPRHARFELSDGTVLEDEYVFCAVTNTTSAGGVIQLPKDRVSFSDGRLEVLLIKHPQTPAELSSLVTALLTVTPEASPLVEFRHADGVTVTTDEPTTWSLDGEEAPSGTSVSISCVPSAVRLRAFLPDHTL